MLPLESKNLPGNINIHLFPTNKFKTVLVSVFIQQVLDKELAAKTALLPAVMEQGTKKYPTYKDLKRKLEMLYGAEVGTDVLKKGERHILSFSLEVVNDKYACGEELLKEGFSILKSILTEPLVENGGFKKEYVEQEKEQLAKEVKGLINDKVNYALERCVQEMCAGERFGVYKYGDLEHLEKVAPDELYGYYSSLLQENPVDIFLVGEVEPKTALSLVEEAFSFPRKGEFSLPPVDTGPTPSEVRYREERLPVNQGKLTLGFRTNTLYRDEDYPALLFYNGILGGFPHSKLFQNVREKASLAYYAFSRLDKHKGIQLVASGIEVGNYQRALEIIQDQVELIKKGEISREEMENTRRALINQLRIVGDSPYNLVNFFLDSLVGGREESAEEMIKRIEKVKEKDVIEVAGKVRMDTIFFLRSFDGEGGEGA